MGKKLEYIVKGAIAQCNQSKVPMIAQLQLIADNLFNQVNGNFFASDKTLGPVFGPAPFGICNMIPPTPAVPTPPCVCVITAWTGAEDGIIHNKISHPLTTDSKGTCALGGSISFKTSGQLPKPSVPATGTASSGNMNPLSDNVMKKVMNNINKADKKGPLYAHFDGKWEDINLLCEQLNSHNLEYKMVKTQNGVAIAILGIKGKKLSVMKKIRRKKNNIYPPKEKGYWDGEEGKSLFHPEGKAPEGYPPKRPGKQIARKEWGKSGDKPGTIIGDLEKMVNDHLENNGKPRNYTFKGVKYKNGEAKFHKHCVGEVTLDTYALDREINFQRARELMAEDLNKRHPKGIYDEETKEWRKYTAKDVDDWMEEHELTWHECQDRRTMQKVPSHLHGNLEHTGGFSMEKGMMNDVFGLTTTGQDYNEMITMSQENQALLGSGKSVDEVKLNMEKQGADLAQKRALEKQKTRKNKARSSRQTH